MKASKTLVDWPGACNMQRSLHLKIRMMISYRKSTATNRDGALVEDDAGWVMQTLLTKAE